MSDTALEQVLADRRGEKQSRADFRAFADDRGATHDFRDLQNVQRARLRRPKVGNPTSGKIVPRIVVAMTHNDTRRCVVYYLADPRTPRHPRYVGMTSDPIERQRRHRFRNSTNDSLAAWKKALDADGLTPLLIVLESFNDRESARQAEWRRINRWRRRGLCDCNSGREGSMDLFGLLCAGKYHGKVS